MTQTTTTTTSADDQLAELEERVRDGDTTVTPAALAKARQAADHERLVLEAAERAEQRAAEEQAERVRQEARDAARAVEGRLLGELQDLYGAAVAAVAALNAGIDAYQTEWSRVTSQAERAGVPEAVERLPALVEQARPQRQTNKYVAAAFDEAIIGVQWDMASYRTNEPYTMRAHPLHSAATIERENQRFVEQHHRQVEHNATVRVAQAAEQAEREAEERAAAEAFAERHNALIKQARSEGF